MKTCVFSFSLILFVQLLFPPRILAIHSEPTTARKTIYSEILQDSVVLFYTKISETKNPTRIHLYLDASIRFGKDLREFISINQDSFSADEIFIGVGYKHFSRKFRRQAFIENTHDSGRTWSSSMSLFLIQELIPDLMLEFPESTLTNIYGHSLSGLFVLHEQLNHPRLFRNYIALSPSVWVNNYQILDRYDSTLCEAADSLNIRLGYGSHEVLNRVRTGCNRIWNLNINCLKVQRLIAVGKGHNSSVKTLLSDFLLEFD
ncbi:MAG: hypothetical protein GC181_07120 [Bacteroidetes bacterium]|nr:hypothetical protein [Bacteroidota bacterium]